MTAAATSTARVISLPVRPVDPTIPMAAHIQLAQRLGAWRRANPNATVEEDLAAGAEIAKELGL